jgi:hypothetical protein
MLVSYYDRVGRRMAQLTRTVNPMATVLLHVVVENLRLSVHASVAPSPD